MTFNTFANNVLDETCTSVESRVDLNPVTLQNSIKITLRADTYRHNAHLIEKQGTK